MATVTVMAMVVVMVMVMEMVVMMMVMFMVMVMMVRLTVQPAISLAVSDTKFGSGLNACPSPASSTCAKNTGGELRDRHTRGELPEYAIIQANS